MPHAQPSAHRRVAARRALARHRPRSRPPIERARRAVRLSDLVLALLCLTLLGALGLIAGAALLARALSP